MNTPKFVCLRSGDPKVRRALKMGRRLARIRPAFVAVWIKHLLGVTRLRIETAYGRFLIDPASNFGLRLLGEGDYERDTRTALERHLESCSSFVDVGANEGFFSIVAAKLVGPQGRVLAVEPQDRLQAVLAENISLNDFANIEVIHALVSDSSGFAELCLAPDTNTGSSSLYQSTRYRLKSQTTCSKTLHEIFEERKLQRCDLMKLDIEGGEHRALFGSADLFRKGRVKAICLEMHPALLRQSGVDPIEISEFLKHHQYHQEGSCWVHK